MIKVLLADDSGVVRAVLRDIFHATSDITVIGEAGNGKEAISLTEQLKPDLIVMDIMMPVMDGLTAIEEIMARFPTPILVLSATMDEREVNHAFTAIKKGALDVMEKPLFSGLNFGSSFEALIIEKARLLSRIKVIRRWPTKAAKVELKTVSPKGGREILAIGASTGGPKAVMSIMKGLPTDFRASVFIVQHIASGFARGFAQWLDRDSGIKVRLATDGQIYGKGEAFVAPNDCHMVLEHGRIKLIKAEPVNCCRPSIDVLFNSLAEEEGARVVGVLLTGMGRDGAQGLRHIKDKGGFTMVQDEKSCTVFGMPKAAIALNAVDEILPLLSMPEAITKIFSY
ncbi:MAG TPA: chemotaxis-specific protein-glutamate methyltransferase CheB [Geobacteraceae bacterium]|nr:chemotaxis-specific protein-glutamate methyltransferase CheB [Geobacteraceae bacterium]